MILRRADVWFLSHIGQRLEAPLEFGTREFPKTHVPTNEDHLDRTRGCQDVASVPALRHA